MHFIIYNCQFFLSECLPGFIKHKGRCLLECPQQYYPSFLDDYQYSTLEESNKKLIRSICLPCHYTCEHCSGSNDYQCTSCFPDAVLTSINNYENYCYPHSIITNIELSKWYTRVYVLLWIILFLFILVMIAYIVHERRMRKQLLNETDTINSSSKIEHNKKTTVYSDSD